jgi:MGT family glycosyltransferase
VRRRSSPSRTASRSPPQAPICRFYPGLYRAAVEALATLPIRVLLTVGDGRDLDELGRLPDTVHVERWVPQDDVLPHAAAFVSHGGFGSTLGALSHGVPLVVVPLFSADQWENGAAVARAGAGLALDDDRATRRVLDPPRPETSAALGRVVRRVLSEPSFRRAATRAAEDMRALPDVDAAVRTLQALVTDVAGRRPRSAAPTG